MKSPYDINLMQNNLYVNVILPFTWSFPSVIVLFRENTKGDHTMQHDDFVGIFENWMSAEECDKIQTLLECENYGE